MGSNCKYCSPNCLCSNPKLQNGFWFISWRPQCCEIDRCVICQEATRLPPPPKKIVPKFTLSQHTMDIANGKCDKPTNAKINKIVLKKAVQEEWLGFKLTNHARVRLKSRFGLNEIPPIPYEPMGKIKGYEVLRVTWDNTIYLVVSKDKYIISVWNRKIIGTMWDNIAIRGVEENQGDLWQ